MKRELYQFYPEVYPFNLWIYVGKDVSGMVECFNNDFSYVDNSKAVTVSVPYGGCKLNPNTGFLIWFLNKKIIDFETVCHEASHVSTEAFNFLGEEVKKLRTILVSQWMDREKVRGSKDRNSRR
jgi:hypothetical protein